MDIYSDFIEDYIVEGGAYILRLNDAYHEFRRTHHYTKISKPTFKDNMTILLGNASWYLERHIVWFGFKLLKDEY